MDGELFAMQKNYMMVSNRLISNKGGMNTRTTVDVSQSGQLQQQSQPKPINYDNKIFYNNIDDLGCVAIISKMAICCSQGKDALRK